MQAKNTCSKDSKSKFHFGCKYFSITDNLNANSFFLKYNERTHAFFRDYIDKS